MARTFRRNGAPHLWASLSRTFWSRYRFYVPDDLALRSPEERRLRARFRSDAGTYRGPPPRFRRPLHRQLRTHNEAQLRRALNDPGYDPVFETRNLGSARRAWDWH